MEVAANGGVDLDDAVLVEAAARREGGGGGERNGGRNEGAIVIYDERGRVDIPGMSSGSLWVVSSRPSVERAESGV